jgi:hypothetical protein
MRSSTLVKVFATQALALGFGVCFAETPLMDVEAARLKPLVQQGSSPVVVEGALEQPDLKDVPLPQVLPASGARFGSVRMDAAEYLEDVEILTGIPSAGFELPFVVKNYEAKR